MRDAHSDRSLSQQSAPPTHASAVSATARRVSGEAARRGDAEQIVDHAMLQALLILPLQRVEDLALLVGVSLRTAYRHLDRLCACGLVETLVPGNLGRASSQIAYLTRVGTRALAGGDPQAARQLAHAWGADMRGLVRLLPRLPARISLLQTLPALLLASRQAQVVSSNGTRPMHGTGQGAPHASPLRWHWMLDYHHTYTYRERPRRLSVDAVLAVRAADGAKGSAEAWHASWVFLDPGIGNTRAVVPRLSALIAYRESSARWPLYAQFPPVLILTASAHRASLWQHAACEAALHLRADPLAGVIQVAPPGSISCWPLSVSGTPLPHSVPEPIPSWIDLTSGTPTTLAALFAAPLAAAALPPGLTTLPQAPLALSHAQAGERSPDSAADSGQIGSADSPVSGSRVLRGAVIPPKRTSKSRTGAGRPDTLSSRLTRARQREEQAGALDSDRRALKRAALAVTLARREETLLDLLARHPLICQDDLAEWLEIAPTWIDRLRRQLRHAGLIQVFRVPESILLPLCSSANAADMAARAVEATIPTPTAEATYLLRLTPLAWSFLAAVYRVSARQLAGGAPSARTSQIAPASPVVNAPRAPVTSRLPGKAVHQASIYRFFTLLLQALDAHTRAGSEPRERLLWWETGVACVRRYRSMGRWGTLRPDAAGEYQSGGRRVRFWLEWDTGSMGLERLREKLERYATYAQTTTWRLEDAHSLPVLLIVTPDRAQEERVARLVDELCERARLRWPGPLLVRTTTATRVARDGPLAPIWLPLLPRMAPTHYLDQGEGASLVSPSSDQAPLIRPLERVPPAPRRDPSPHSQPPAGPSMSSAGMAGRPVATSTPAADAAADTSGGGMAG